MKATGMATLAVARLDPVRSPTYKICSAYLLVTLVA
jgi:hypothetical protein